MALAVPFTAVAFASFDVPLLGPGQPLDRRSWRREHVGVGIRGRFLIPKNSGGVCRMEKRPDTIQNIIWTFMKCQKIQFLGNGSIVCWVFGCVCVCARVRTFYHNLPPIVFLSFGNESELRITKKSFKTLYVPGSKLPLFPYNRGWSSTQ